MKFSIIYKQSLQRPRFLEIDSEGFESIDTAGLRDIKNVFVYGVVDYANQRVIPAAMTVEGKIIEVPDGDYGELTPAEYFEENQE